jgi:hypothetical protein
LSLALYPLLLKVFSQDLWNDIRLWVRKLTEELHGFRFYAEDLWADVGMLEFTKALVDGQEFLFGVSNSNIWMLESSRIVLGSMTISLEAKSYACQLIT